MGSTIPAYWKYGGGFQKKHIGDLPAKLAAFFFFFLINGTPFELESVTGWQTGYSDLDVWQMFSQKGTKWAHHFKQNW